jgi:hypothetical protein
MPTVKLKLYMQKQNPSGKKKCTPTFSKKECTIDQQSMPLKSAREYDTLKAAINAHVATIREYKDCTVIMMYVRDCEAELRALGFWIKSSVLLEEWFDDYEHNNMIDVGVIIGAAPGEGSSSDSE